MKIAMFGLVDKKTSGVIETQLWMEYQPEQAQQYRFVIRNVDLAAGGRRCELDSGTRASYDEALAAGQASLEECAKPVERPQEQPAGSRGGVISKTEHSIDSLRQHNPTLFHKLLAYARREKVTIHEEDWDSLVQRNLVNDDGSMNEIIRSLVIAKR